MLNDTEDHGPRAFALQVLLPDQNFYNTVANYISNSQNIESTFGVSENQIIEKLQLASYLVKKEKEKTKGSHM